MTKDQVQECVMGAAVVLLIYAVVSHARQTAAATPAFAVNNPFNPPQGQSFDPTNPGAYIPLGSLLNGTVNDIYSGGTQTVATTGDIVQQAALDYYQVPNNGKISPDSVVRVPGADYGYYGSAGL
jgi:hypothetical protein